MEARSRALVVGAVIALAACVPPSVKSPPPPAGYRVVGGRIVDANGSPRVFHGLNRPSLEWTPRGESLSPGDFQAIASWGADVVRIPLSQDFWLDGAALHDPDYRATVARTVAWAHAAGLDVILDLHWSDAGDLRATKARQHEMPDENSLAFWREVARGYRDDPRVLFDVYNEPHDVSWDVWQRGGRVGTWDAVGMQTLVDAIRAEGAENVIVVGGLDFAFDLSGVPSHRIEGRNVVYATHPYDHPGKGPADWDAKWGFLAATDVVMVAEMGDFDCSPGFYDATIRYADAKGLSWLAWAWYPGGCKFPALIDGWNGEPSAAGAIVKRALLSHRTGESRRPRADRPMEPERR